MIRTMLTALVIAVVSPVAAQVPCAITGVTDGDTIRAECEPWPGDYKRILVRLRGIDTPEKNARCESESVKAEAAWAALCGLLGSKIVATSSRKVCSTPAVPATLLNIKPDKYSGRFDATVMVHSGGQDIDLAARMIVLGHARAYDGKGPRRSWCD